MKVRKMASIEELEKYFHKCKKSGSDMVWRITETPNWYKIQAEEEGINAAKELAYYQTGKWSEIVEFCGSHCNHENDTICGLGCTDLQLVDATTKYIHSHGKLLKYELEERRNHT